MGQSVCLRDDRGTGSASRLWFINMLGTSARNDNSKEDIRAGFNRLKNV